MTARLLIRLPAHAQAKWLLELVHLLATEKAGFRIAILAPKLIAETSLELSQLRPEHFFDPKEFETSSPTDLFCELAPQTSQEVELTSPSILFQIAKQMQGTQGPWLLTADSPYHGWGAWRFSKFSLWSAETEKTLNEGKQTSDKLSFFERIQKTRKDRRVNRYHLEDSPLQIKKVGVPWRKLFRSLRERSA